MTLASLIEQLQQAEGPDQTLGDQVLLACGWTRYAEIDPGLSADYGEDIEVWYWRDPAEQPYSTERPDPTRSIEAAMKLVPAGWWVTSGLCALTGHASIGPDYNGPMGEQLKQQWPEDEWHAGIDADLSPGDGFHRTAIAICVCCLRARQSMEAQTDG